MKITYSRNYIFFDDIYKNRGKVSNKEIKSLSKLGLPVGDKSFIKNVNNLRKDLESASDLKVFNSLKSGRNKAEILSGMEKKKNLEFKVRIDLKHRKHFLCIDCGDSYLKLGNWKGDYEHVNNIEISCIHPHEYIK